MHEKIQRLEEKIAYLERHGVRREQITLLNQLGTHRPNTEAELVRMLGAEVVAACFVIDLPELGGAEKIRRLGVPVRTLIAFDGH